MTGYKVSLEVYNGPLDLLLFLIRREEIDISDIPIARITSQYLQYVEMLRQLDPEIAGEFLVLAATLMEIKSRTLLPTPAVDDVDEEITDPRLELVRQLLEYKKYKDAAYSLEDAAGARAQKYARQPALPPEPEEAAELDNLEIWDLFDAFNRLLEQTGRRGAVHQVDVDDTPVALHAADIVDSLERAGGRQDFEEVFAGRTRAEMIGLFLALLELIRQRRIQAAQERPFGPILIVLVDPTPLDEGNKTLGKEAPDRLNVDMRADGGDSGTAPADTQEHAVSAENGDAAGGAQETTERGDGGVTDADNPDSAAGTSSGDTVYVEVDDES